MIAGVGYSRDERTRARCERVRTGAGRGRRWSIKDNVAGVTWWHLVRHDGDRSAGRHKAGGGVKAALVCYVRM